MCFFNNSLSNIFIHSFLKEKYRGAVQLSCAENLLKTQDRIYTIIGYAFLAIGRVQSLRGRPARPDLQVFTLKTRKTCQTTSTAPVTLLPAGLRTGHWWFNAGAGAPMDLCMRSFQMTSMHPPPVVCESGKYICRKRFAAD